MTEQTANIAVQDNQKSEREYPGLLEIVGNGVYNILYGIGYGIELIFLGKSLNKESLPSQTIPPQRAVAPSQLEGQVNPITMEEALSDRIPTPRTGVPAIKPESYSGEKPESKKDKSTGSSADWALAGKETGSLRVPTDAQPVQEAPKKDTQGIESALENALANVSKTTGTPNEKVFPDEPSRTQVVQALCVYVNNLSDMLKGQGGLSAIDGVKFTLDYANAGNFASLYGSSVSDPGNLESVKNFVGGVRSYTQSIEDKIRKEQHEIREKMQETGRSDFRKSRRKWIAGAMLLGALTGLLGHCSAAKSYESPQTGASGYSATK